MAITIHPESVSVSPGIAQPTIRRISTADLNWALREGWSDMKEKRGDLLFIGLIYPMICFMAVALASNESLLPLLFPAVAGLSIAGPAVAAGFYEMARRRENGESATWSHFLDPLKGRSRTPLAMLTTMLAVLFVGWLAAAYAVYALTLGSDGHLPAADLFSRIFTTQAGWTMLIVGNLVGLGFAVVTLLVSFVSFPMVVDQPVDAGTAIRTSLSAARENPREAIGWGLRVAGLLAVGMVPFAVGLAVVLPLLGYATWHLYTRIVAR